MNIMYEHYHLTGSETQCNLRLSIPIKAQTAYDILIFRVGKPGSKIRDQITL